jgi:hypothetical protein
VTVLIVTVTVATVQFSRAAERALGRRIDAIVEPAGTGLSKLNSMPGLELGEVPHGTEAVPWPPAHAGDGWAGQVRSTF